MLKLTILLTFIGLVNTSHAQDLINLRLRTAPIYSNGTYDKLQAALQGSFNINPKKGALGLELGIELQYTRSKDYFYSCNCEPYIWSGDIPNRDELSSYSSLDYRNTMTVGAFSRLIWNPRESKRLRFSPSLGLHINDQLFSNYYQDRVYIFNDGSSYDPPKINLGGRSDSILFGLYLVPVIQFDYLIIPKWDVRLGINGRFNLYVTGAENLGYNTIVLGASLSKSLMQVKG